MFLTPELKCPTWLMKTIWITEYDIWNAVKFEMGKFIIRVLLVAADFESGLCMFPSLFSKNQDKR